MNTGLAKKLAAHPKFRWMRGMWCINVRAQEWPEQAKFYKHYRFDVEYRDAEQADRDRAAMAREGWYPDLDDPATVGCLWAMLVFATKKYHVRPELEPEAVHFVGAIAFEHDWFVADSDGEALASALLEVWEEG